MPAAERSSNVCMYVCMALLLDCQLVPIPSQFAVCVRIDLALRRILSSFLLRYRSDLLARGWGSSSHSADDLAFLDGSPACFDGSFFFLSKMNFEKVLSV